MATVTGLTAERMEEIEAACVVDGTVVGDNLILIKHDESTIDAGNVRGTAGSPGADATSLVLSNMQTGSYTLVLGDSGKAVEVDSSSSSNVTIPPNSSVAFPIGTTIEICRYGSGSVTVTPGSEVTMPNRVQVAGTSYRTIANQMSSVSIRKRDTNEWILVGDIT